ncbi:MAG: hypothetical protein HY690_20940 [Chloroflexi bacterium]|nr:hypothetical protein [Chloroflexota bacterium]
MLQRVILVAEEDSKVRRVMRVNLEHAGLTVYEAARFSHLAYLLLTYPAALVVLSLTLPGLPVLEAEAAGGLGQGWRGIPLLVTSPEASHRVQAARLGAEFLFKPFDPGDLVQRALRLLGLAHYGEGLALADPGGG